MNSFMNLLRFLFLLALTAAVDPGTVRAQTPAPPISGLVVSQQRGPVGGVTVSLVHPVVGRSAPSFSASNGAYFFTNVTPQPQPYFIEAYWGNQLLFRGQILYQGRPVQFNIALP
jgi:hypothetical protein